MKIQVLGSGCATCKKLYELTQQAVKELKINREIEYITDVSKIIEMGVMSSPVLVINGKAVLAGSVPDMKKIIEIIKKNIYCCEDNKSCGIKCKPSETKEKTCSCGGDC